MSLEDDVKNLTRQVSELHRNTASPWIRIAGGGGGGGGGTKRTSLLKATDTIPGRTGDVPGEGVDFDVVDGDEPEGAIKNWSTVAILEDAYMITVQIGDFDVIVNAFC